MKPSDHKRGSDRPTQLTQPKKGEPVEIPIPTRKTVFGVFEKVAKASDPDSKPKD